MTKVVISSIWYPLAMATYFLRALRRRKDIELTLVGPTTGNWIPWKGGMTIPAKYAVTPDIPLAFPFVTPYDPTMVETVLGFEPDIWLQVDAGLHTTRRPKCKVSAHVATDPHVLKYDLPRSYSDKFFCMQTPYMAETDYWLPYACDPEWHAPFSDNRSPELDGCLIGLLYESRVKLAKRLNAEGFKIRMETGLVGDECREAYSHSKVGLNWSCLKDLTARVFEIMGMGLCPVINRVPDLVPLFEEGVHYLGFDTEEEAVGQFRRAVEDSELRKKIGRAASDQVHAMHTWDHRIAQLLDVCLG